MYPMIEHPEIGHIQRTGYPGWMADDESAGAYDEDALYEERRERELFGDE